MQIRKMRIGPDGAATFLEHNTRNRSLRQAVVSRLAEEMKGGRWLCTHQGIAISKNGDVLDGQHRLWAIIESGVTVEMMVATGCDESIRDAIDAGIPRTTSDVLRLRDPSPSDVNKLQAGIATFMLRYRTGKMPARGAQVEFFDKHREAIRFADAALRGGERRNGICVVHFGAVIASAWYTADRQRLGSFAAAVMEGVVSDPSERPAVMIRDLLMMNSGCGLGMKCVLYRKGQRALRAYLDREPITKLYEADEDLFPIPG